jgi:integrase
MRVRSRSIAELAELLRWWLDTYSKPTRHVCPRKGCGHVESADDQDERRCPADGRKLWVKPVVRPIRFHDLRHTTGSLLIMSGADLAAVQRILRHSDPTLTTEVYGRGGAEDAGLVTRLLPEAAAGKTKAGTQGAKPQGFRPSELERETGFEPATLSLGS